MKLEPISLVQSLRSDVCLACGKMKKPGQTLCNREYRKLPFRMKAALYDRLGSGYKEAVEAALDHLGVEVLVLPAKGGA